MTPSRADLIRMAREAGVPEYDDDDDCEAGIDALHRFAAAVERHVWARTPPAMVVNTADLDPALLRDMLAKAPAMPILPMPAEPTPEAIAAAVAAEREACAGLMASLRAKSRNHLFRSALAVAEGEIRARGAA